MTNDKRYQELASKWLNGTINEVEKAEFAAWYNADAGNQLPIPTAFAADETELSARILAKVKAGMGRTDFGGAEKRQLWRAIAVAASLLLSVAIGFYAWHFSPDQAAGKQLAQQDIKPGGNRATLTLADGRTIDLSVEQSGIAVGDGITYLDGSSVLGEQANEGTSEQAGGTERTHTLTTPKGGTYQITLPDGSKVWLNSASVLKYPAKFAPDRRMVELTAGEAYFEIQKSGNPFIVKTRHQEVEVLGTQFNINAYEDEGAVRTTLVEGSVRVHLTPQGSGKARTTVLVPGEQTEVSDRMVNVRKVDTEEFTVWKAGYFYFNDADIYTVVRQLSRWYDIEVRYEIESHRDLFVGKIPRNVSLSAALDVLKKVGVNFELRDRLLVVLPGDAEGE